jgi:phosphate uptake regulator
MEKHIFKFGNSSLAMILPKKWVTKNSLSGASQIFMSENSKGDLVLSSKSTQQTASVRTVNKRTSPELLSRFIYLYYLRGVARLTINSPDGFMEAQIKAMQHQITSYCPGFEITGQSTNEIKIEDLTNIREIDIGKIVARLRSLINQEIAEVREGNAETAGRIEELVDRFYLLGIRYVNIVQPADAIKYYRTILIMENMADDLLRIVSAKKTSPKLIDMIAKAFALSESGFAGDQNAIMETAALRRSAISAIDGSKMDPLYRKIFKGTITACNQIAEFGLLEEDPKTIVY